MSDLIHKADLFNRLATAQTLAEAYAVIQEMPTVDAVPVVRCRDCKHRDPEDRKCDCGHDIMWQLPRDDDWYCADGERKDVVCILE